MIQPIVVYNSKILKTPTEDIVVSDKEVNEAMYDLEETLDNVPGVGLAAPQIGKSLNLFMINYEKSEFNVIRQLFINPRITYYSNKESKGIEGCLSIPDIQSYVYRSDSIEIEYYDINRGRRTETYSGELARIIQHEYDHIKGKLFIDRLSTEELMRITTRLNNVKRGKFSIEYKTISYE